MQCTVRQEAQPARKGGGKGRDEISEKAKKQKGEKGEIGEKGSVIFFFFFLLSPSPPSLAPPPSIAVPFSVDAAALKPSFLPRPLGKGN